MCPLLLLLYLSGVKRMQRYGFIFALKTTDIKRLRQLVNFKITIHFLSAIRDKKQKPTAPSDAGFSRSDSLCMVMPIEFLLKNHRINKKFR